MCRLQQQALLLNAGAEVALGFLTVLQLAAPPRNFLLPLMVWQILRMRFWSPDAAGFHRQVLCCAVLLCPPCRQCSCHLVDSAMLATVALWLGRTRPGVCVVQVWSMLNQRFQPVARAVPLLNTPVGWGQKWFQSGNPVQPQRTQ